MIKRNRHKNNYTCISNDIFKDKDLSMKATGLLCKMLSLPEEWQFSINGLCAICKEQESSIKSALKELENAGYLQIVKLKPNETSSGRYEYNYIVSEHKETEKRANNEQESSLNTQKKAIQEGEIQAVEIQAVEILPVEIQALENHTLYNNNNKLNNKELNNKEVNNNISSVVVSIMEYFNSKAGTNYKATTKETIELIETKLKESFTIEDFKQVIDKKVNDWKGTEYERYIRPKTLFGEKFESYLNEPTKTKNNSFDVNELDDLNFSYFGL